MKRTTKKKSEKYTDVPTTKVKGLFGHLNFLMEGDNPDEYWNALTDTEKKDFSPYMINRFLSMNPDWIDIVDTFQRLTIGPLDRKSVFRLYWEILPKGRVYLKYVKAKDAKTMPVPLATILRAFLMDGESQIREDFKLLMRTKEGRLFLDDLMHAYGMQETEYKKIKKEIGL